MRKAKEIREDWLTVLGALDQEMERWGFVRTRRSYDYKRSRGDVRFTIHMKGDVRSKLARNHAELTVRPLVRVEYPGLGEKLRKLVAGTDLTPEKDSGFTNPDLVILKGIEHWPPLSQREGHRPPADLTGIEDMRASLRVILDFMARWVVPILNKMETFEDLVELHTRQDCQLVEGMFWAIRVAALQADQGDYAAAKATIEKELTDDFPTAAKAGFLKLVERLAASSASG